jgi:dTDP-4-dehydrorhamnose reductase
LEHKPSVFITGGAGLLALNWAVTIRERYAITLGLHKRDVQLAGVAKRWTTLESTDELFRLFEELEPEVVIHTAGMTNIEACEASAELAEHTNVALAANVARACVLTGRKFVHVSTDHLFSGNTPVVTEEHPVSPQNVYGRTKAEAELRVLDACPQALVVRTNFYGWGPSYRPSFSDKIISALRSGKESNLFQDVYYTPIVIEALVSAVHELIDRKAQGIFQVVGDERISKYEFGLKIAEEFRLDARLIKRISLIDCHHLVRRPRDMSLSNQKVRESLGKKLGGVTEHLALLHRQEQMGIARETHEA